MAVEDPTKPAPPHRPKKKRRTKNNDKRVGMLILSNDIPNEVGPNNWLTDLSINGAMGLLRQQFPDIGALISCQWGAILQFDRADSQKWIQIINIHNNHWVMAAQGFGINPNNVLLYDSLDTTEPHPHVVYCIDQLCKTPIGKLTISLMPCQVQKDGFNCGVYSIAFSTALAFNLNPSEMRLDTARMRDHLRECLLLKKMEPFPVLKSTISCKNLRPKKIVSFDLFCKCQMPWYDPDCVVKRYKLLVVCKTCKLSFHDGCEKIPKKALKSTKVDWICSTCPKH